MKTITLQGWQAGKPYPLRCSSLIMGSPDSVSHGIQDQAWRLFDHCLANGIRTFDTARHYRMGETTLGAWIRQHHNRQQIVILTKGGHPNREDPERARVTPTCLDEDIHASLDALATDYIDLYALHRDDPTIDAGELMECLHRHVLAGRIRAIGVSNWSLSRIQQAQAYAARHHLTPLSFTSPQLSLAQSYAPRWPGCVSADGEMQQWHRQNRLPLLAWSSLAGGFFSGRYTPDKLPLEEGMVAAFCHPDNWRRLACAQALAQRKNVSTSVIALAWLLRRPFPCAAITAPETTQELDDTLAAARITLSDQECLWLEEEHHSGE